MIEAIEGAGDILIVVDHASAHVPDDIDLGIDPALLREHIAVDIGAAPLARMLAARLDARALLAGQSRLVIDLNREADHPRVVPTESDGHAIPGNIGVDVTTRVARFHAPWHAAIAAAIAERAPTLIVSLHSFTPALASAPTARPWEIGILYNRDDRAARIAIPALGGAGVLVGDNEPYSGKLLNATMNRHAEVKGLPYLGIEVRQDLIGDDAGIDRWSEILAPLIEETRNGLASFCRSAT